MLRPSHALTVALLWLTVLLLPVRAWATVAMPLTSPSAAVTQVQAGVVGALISNMPCHGNASADDNIDDSAAPQQSCSMCDVCHAAFAGLPQAQPLLPGRPAMLACVAAVEAVETAVLSGPERPPRNTLA